jgi:hypothetical protein
MKKNIIVIFLLLITQLTHSVTKNDVLQVLVGSHTAAFGKNNLYKELIKPDEFNRWNSAIDEVKKYVEAHSSNKLGIKDTDLINALASIEKANIDLVNTIKTIRASLQSPDAVKQNIAILENIKNTMIQVQKKLNSALFILNKEEKMITRDILVNAAMFIETTAAKAIRDVAKI